MFRFERNEIRESRTTIYAQDVEVRFQDVDAAGVVYFARFFDYMHAAYEGLLREAGCALPEVLKDGQWGAPLRHAEADYLKPVSFGDPIRITLCCVQLEETEVVLGWRLDRSGGPEQGQRDTMALLQSVHTFIDRETRKRRSVPLKIAARLRQQQVE